MKDHDGKTRVAISGSRGFVWEEMVWKVVDRIMDAGHIIHVGDAPNGVDRFVREYHEQGPRADEWASDTLDVYEARWRIEGKRAGHNRNDWMVSESDRLVALFAPGEMSPGTFDAIKCAKARNVPVDVFWMGFWGTPAWDQTWPDRGD